MTQRQSGPNRDLGPCCINWDPSGVNLELKPTFGSTMFNSTDNRAPIFHEEHGVAPVDSIFSGRVATLEVPMTSPNLVALEAVIPGATKHKVGGKTHVLRVPNPVGTRAFPSAVEIRVKPVISQVCSTNVNEWLHLWRAYPIAALAVGFEAETGQRVYNVTFECYPDDASGNVGQIWRQGPAPS